MIRTAPLLAALSLCLLLPRGGAFARRSRVRMASAAAAPGSRLKLHCPAKLNLFLRVVRRREDGYHDLASLFQTVALGDTLVVEVAGAGAAEDVLRCEEKGVPTDKSNLVMKAFELFRAKTGLDTKFVADLEKATPSQAGLGGGSSDAAAALFAANRLCGCPASEEDLVAWSGEIGSDISFFFSTGTAYCTGRGEVVEPLAPLPAADLYIVKPPDGLSTPAVFKALDLDSRSAEAPEALLAGFVEGGVAGGRLVNDLEPPAFACLPSLRDLKAALLEEHGFERAMMSGSGTSIFALGEPGDAAALEAFAEERGLFLAKTTFINREAGSEDWYAA